MRKTLAIASAMLMSSLLAGPALAQTVTTQTTKTVQTGTGTMDTVGPHNPYCGAWVNDTWTPNGNCVSETTTTTTTSEAAPPATTAVAGGPARVAERISGKIINVNGNMVTLQHGDRSMQIDDSRALDLQDTGKVATGRDVIAHGYWQGGVFYANRFD